MSNLCELFRASIIECDNSLYGRTYFRFRNEINFFPFITLQLQKKMLHMGTRKVAKIITAEPKHAQITGHKMTARILNEVKCISDWYIYIYKNCVLLLLLNFDVICLFCWTSIVKVTSILYNALSLTLFQKHCIFQRDFEFSEQRV